MKSRDLRESGAANLSVILVLVAAAVILVVVLLMRGGEEGRKPSKSSPLADQRSSPAEPRAAAPPTRIARESKTAPGQGGTTAESRQTGSDEEIEIVEVDVESYEYEPADGDNGYRESGSRDIPPGYEEALRNPPEMPESLRRAIENDEINKIPPEFQAAIDAPLPTVPPDVLEQLERQETERYIPPEILEKFQEAGRRMEAGE